MVDWWQPLIGVTVGWVLGQSTEWWRQKHRDRRYRNAIYAELKDVHSIIKTRVEILREILRTFLAEHTATHFVADIDFRIFQAHFPQVSLQFTEDERLALTSIYKLVEHLNYNFSLIRGSWDIYNADTQVSEDNLRRIVQVAEGSYSNVRELDLMIELLLRDKKHHKIRDSANQIRLNAVAAEVETELRGLIQTQSSTSTTRD